MMTGVNIYERLRVVQSEIDIAMKGTDSASSNAGS